MRGDTGSSSPAASEHRGDTQPPSQRRNPGRPKGSRNRNKTQVPLNDTLKHLQTMLKALLARVGDLIPLRYLVLDGYFGHNPALQIIPKTIRSLLIKSALQTIALQMGYNKLWIDFDLKVARQYSPLFSIHGALRRTWTPAYLRAAFQAAADGYRNTEFLPRRMETLQPKSIKFQSCTIKSSRNR